jgi:methylmalonyl-CoA mutase N-terminal domain/subunit
MGGSWYIETLTNEMRRKMEEIMHEVDEAGGIVRLVAKGIIQDKVSEQAYQHQIAVESGAFRKVGVNCYRLPGEEEVDVKMHPYDEAETRRQIASLDEVRASRDSVAAAQALTKIGDAARAGANVMPAVVEAIKAYASVGEITGQLAAVYGRYREPVML